MLYFIGMVICIKIIEIYEYGNGDHADSFRTRVQKQVDKVKEKYEIVRMEKHFIGGHYVGKNCMGMDVFRGDELFLTLYCNPKDDN